MIIDDDDVDIDLDSFKLHLEISPLCVVAHVFVTVHALYSRIILPVFDSHNEVTTIVFIVLYYLERYLLF